MLTLLLCAQDWIFDCLITFLKSPRWKTPVVSYIEEHCLIFDNEEENKLEYTTIHMVSTALLHRPKSSRLKVPGA